MGDAARAVFARWREAIVDADEDMRGVQTEGASDASMDAFERKFDVVLPASFRELYRLSDGTAEMDGHEQIFWPLSAITRTLDSFDAGDPDATWLGFADFRLQTAVFYLRADRHTHATSVWIDRGPPGKPLLKKVEKLTDTFDDYLLRYAEDALFWRKKKRAVKTKAKT